MPVIPVVGRKSFKNRMLIAALYALLALGAVTMIYPFGLMLSTAVTSNADWEQFNLIPRYWIDRGDLFRKYLIDKTGVGDLAYEHQREKWFIPRDVTVAELRNLMETPEEYRVAMDRDYRDFFAGLDDGLKQLYFIAFGNLQHSVLSLRQEYFDWLSKKYAQNLDRVNRAYNDTAETWEELGMPRSYGGGWEPQPLSPRHKDWREFVVSRPYYQQRVVSLDPLVFGNLLGTYGGVDELNRTRGTSFKSLFDVRWKILSRSAWGRELQLILI